MTVLLFFLETMKWITDGEEQKSMVVVRGNKQKIPTFWKRTRDKLHKHEKVCSVQWARVPSRLIEGHSSRLPPSTKTVFTTRAAKITRRDMRTTDGDNGHGVVCSWTVDNRSSTGQEASGESPPTATVKRHQKDRHGRRQFRFPLPIPPAHPKKRYKKSQPARCSSRFSF